MLHLSSFLLIGKRRKENEEAEKIERCIQG